MPGKIAACFLCVAAVCGSPALLQGAIQLEPYIHEAAQFGYDPQYVVNTPSFDSLNRPYIRSRSTNLDDTGAIQTLRDGAWVTLDFTEAVKAHLGELELDRYERGGGWEGGQVVFDAEDHLYTQVKVRSRDNVLHSLLLYSTDYGQTFQVYDLPTTPGKHVTFGIETQTGNNRLDAPPLLAMVEYRADNPGQWTDTNNFYVVQPRKVDGGLVFDKTLVSADALNMTQHSGGASFAVSTQAGTFITWAEVGDGIGTGNPVYAARYDPATGALDQKTFLGYDSGPANDSHNTPGITVASDGYVHVISGAHGSTIAPGSFRHAISRDALSLTSGFSELQDTLGTGVIDDEGQSHGAQTYLSLVIDDQDTLHTVFAQVRLHDQPDAKSGRRTLSYQAYVPGAGWETDATVLVEPPKTGYSVYYHKLSIDNLDRMFLIYSYYTTDDLYSELDGRYHYPAMLMSDDGGLTWRLATTEDFLWGIEAFELSLITVPEPASAALMGLLGWSLLFGPRRRTGRGVE